MSGPQTGILNKVNNHFDLNLSNVRLSEQILRALTKSNSRIHEIVKTDRRQKRREQNQEQRNIPTK